MPNNYRHPTNNAYSFVKSQPYHFISCLKSHFVFKSLKKTEIDRDTEVYLISHYSKIKPESKEWTIFIFPSTISNTLNLYTFHASWMIYESWEKREFNGGGLRVKKKEFSPLIDLLENSKFVTKGF